MKAMEEAVEQAVEALEATDAREDAEATTLDQPYFRGWLHAATFFASIPAGVALVLSTDGTAKRVAASIYFASLLIGFGTSAAYHRLPRSPRARAIMRRLDHSMIFVLIAGTYVPLCIVALPPSWGIPLLSGVGAAAIFGMVIALTEVAWGRILRHVLYLVTGWAAIAATPAMVDHLTAAQLALLLAGGIIYTAGVPVLLLNRPDPSPTWFGYHEVWHLCTVAAAVAQFAAMAAILR